jgi:hypothetical protein
MEIVSHTGQGPFQTVHWALLLLDLLVQQQNATVLAVWPFLMLSYNNRPLYYYPAAVAEGVAALQTTTANPLEPIGSLICEMIQSANKPRIKI